IKNKILKLIQGSDYFVLSSTYETFGVVLIEAMSCGLPVISTKSEGPISIVQDESLGLLCDHTIDSMSKALIEISEKKYNSQKIREYIIDNFSQNIITNKLEKIYTKCYES
ncbi:glycosyltransferase, partial [bacterium]|nr:glycosyltransferase [bacterium]